MYEATRRQLASCLLHDSLLLPLLKGCDLRPEYLFNVCSQIGSFRPQCEGFGVAITDPAPSGPRGILVLCPQLGCQYILCPYASALKDSAFV